MRLGSSWLPTRTLVGWLASGTITSSSGHLTTDTWAAYLVHGGGDRARRTAPGQIPRRSRHDVERRRVTSVSRQRSRSARRPFTQPPDDRGPGSSDRFDRYGRGE